MARFIKDVAFVVATAPLWALMVWEELVWDWQAHRGAKK